MQPGNLSVVMPRFMRGIQCVPSMVNSSEVQVLYPV
jgi:hypothetical protein